MPMLFDEPFSDSSQIPTYLISKFAKEKVTVSLSGDGGDELFGGYNRYVSAMSLASILYRLPLSIQKILHSSLSFIPLNLLQKIGNLSNIDQLESKFKKALIIMNSHNFQDMYLNLITSVPSSSNFVLNSASRKPFVLQKDKWPSFKEFENCMMYLDSLTYLPDDILTKVDRSAMAVSLETRVPFLDPKLIEFAWTLPVNMKIRNGKGKWILRKLLNNLVPEKLTDRPKKGFAIPLGDWLKGPLREWSEDLLDPHKLKEQGIFESSEIISKWNDHLKGSNDWHGFLWSVLMFQSWYENSKN
jgi:asparagine synthase (glutamine-hydrolysing)